MERRQVMNSPFTVRLQPYKKPCKINLTTAQKVALASLLLVSGVVVVVGGVVASPFLAASAARKAVHRRKEAAKSKAAAIKRNLELMRLTECEVCMEEKRVYGGFVENGDCPAGFKCCQSCWKNYFDTDVDERASRMRAAREWKLDCMCGCGSSIDHRVLERFAPDALKRVEKELGFRKRLLNRRGKHKVRHECDQDT
jgi:hypothetical protein